jgi:hypothetical protein
MDTYMAPTSDNFIDRLASGNVGSSANIIQQQRAKESLRDFDVAWKTSATQDRKA